MRVGDGESSTVPRQLACESHPTSSSLLSGLGISRLRRRAYVLLEMHSPHDELAWRESKPLIVFFPLSTAVRYSSKLSGSCLEKCSVLFFRHIEETRPYLTSVERLGVVNCTTELGKDPTLVKRPEDMGSLLLCDRSLQDRRK